MYSFISPPSSLSIVSMSYQSISHLSGIASKRELTLPHPAATHCQVPQLWVGLQEPLLPLCWRLGLARSFVGLVFTLIAAWKFMCAWSFIFIGHKQEVVSMSYVLEANPHIWSENIEHDLWIQKHTTWPTPVCPLPEEADQKWGKRMGSLWRTLSPFSLLSSVLIRKLDSR